MASPPLRVAFLHPDLGLGGAERLVVDAAAGLAARGHSVTMYTTHYEPGRSFAETRSGAFAVRVHGAWLPRAVAGRLHVLCAAVRMVWLAVRVAAAGGPPADVLIVDQVAAAVPVLRLLYPRARVLFYCHFPDMLLAPRTGALRALYRAPFDALEEVATGLAHGVLVNSRFTRGIFASAFKLLAAGGLAPAVLYPCVDADTAAGMAATRSKRAGGSGRGASPARLRVGAPSSAPGAGAATLSAASSAVPQTVPCRVLLSINRFERKKDLPLALRAFASAGGPQVGPLRNWHLVLAGGYDPRLPENVEHFEELRALASELGLAGPGGFACARARPDALRAVLPGWPESAPPSESQVLVGARVTLVRSFADAQKGALLSAATAVLYTPAGEHFGIVPLECMASQRPVIAAASGGPLESVVHNCTGVLCDPGSVEAFAAAIRSFATGERDARAMGAAGLAHVQAHFSRPAFAAALEGHCRTLVACEHSAWPRAWWLSPLLALTLALPLAAAVWLLMSFLSLRSLA